MAYIVACIEFDDKYNLKNVNIVDDESNLSNETLKKIIENKKTKFYIKILVNSCSYSSSDPDCFMLSNNNCFKLDFETSVPTGNILSEAFLNRSSSTSSSASNVNAPGSNASGSNVNASGSNASSSNSFDDFKARIIKELTNALTKESDFDKFKARIIKELINALTKESDFDKFKARIIKELTNALTPP